MQACARFLRWCCRAAAPALIALAASGGEPAETAASSPRLATAPAQRDYFPLGVVRGDPAPALAAGFSQVQEAVQAPDFTSGKPYPAPSPFQHEVRDLRYFSLALAADSLPGARDELDLFNPALKPHLENYGRAHVRSRVQSPLDASVQMWGLDNEWEPPLRMSPGAQTAFVASLRETYAGDIAALNQAWGTQFDDFTASLAQVAAADDAWRSHPGAFLDWYAFASEHFLQLLAAQARAMQAADPRARGVVNKSTQLTLERPMTSRTRLFDHARFAELMRPYGSGLYGIDMYGAGDRQAYETSYIYNSVRPLDGASGHGVLLTETNTHGDAAHQFASTFWRLLANGAKGMMFFTQGNAAAARDSDWNRYAMRDPDTGRYTARWFYAARLAAAIRRTEGFWAQAIPAPVPRVALLLPQRDVLLAENSTRNPAEGRFSYARNERWLVYRWLREQGYWVDVLPYAKLKHEALRTYDALLLVGAEHLRAEESAAVLQYVAQGGVLVGDTMPGYFDEHHRVTNAMADAAAIDVVRHEAARRMRLDIGATAVTGMAQYELTAPDADVLARDADGVARALLQQHGNGTMLLLPFELGSLQPGRPRAPDDDGGSGTWLASLLQQANVRPAYRAHVREADDAGTHLLRVEQPYVDAAGNVALVVATRGRTQPEPVPAGTIDIALPEGNWHRAWWSSAEDAALQPLAISTLGDGRHRLALPAVTSAGIVYLFREHAPLLGFGPVESIATHADVPARETPAAIESGVRAKAGEAFTQPVQLVNASAHALGAGVLHIDAPAGWTVSPARVDVRALPTGEMHVQSFTVTPPDEEQLAPQYPQALVARWTDGGGSTATMSMLVELAPDPAQRSLLLSGNASWSRRYPYRIDAHRLDAHVSYRHLQPAEEAIDDPASLRGTRGALLNGFGSAGGERNSLNRGAYVPSHYVRYRAREAEILFDLRTTRHIARIHVVNGPEHVTPLSVETYTSVDGEHFARNDTLKLSTPALENVIPMHQIEARYVKLRVTWPAAGGTLDEIEIWGR
ncbi:MAG: beta-galactosidase [Gammaproteobacteria bacterium]